MKTQAKQSLEFVKLLAANFISQTGTSLLTLGLSAFIFSQSQSILYASLVIVISYLPSLFVSSYLGQLIDKKISKKLMIQIEFISLLISMLCGLVVLFELPIYCLAFCLILRSLLNFSSKTSFNKWLKMISPAPLQKNRIKLHKLSFFLAVCFAGLLVSQYLSKDSILNIIYVDALTYFICILIICLFNRASKNKEIENYSFQRASLWQTYQYIFSMPALKSSFIMVVLAQGILQGSYSVYLNYLPLQKFMLPIKTVGTFQVFSVLGILMGFSIVFFIPKFMQDKKVEIPYKSLISGLLGLICMTAIAENNNLPQTLVLFFTHCMFYELIYLHQSAEFFKYAPEKHIAKLQFTLQASAGAFMSLSIFIFSFILEHLNLASATLVMITFASLAWIYLCSAKSRNIQVLERL